MHPFFLRAVLACCLLTATGLAQADWRQALPEARLWEVKTLMIQEMLARGILWLGSHNLNYAHSPQAITEILAAYDEVLALVARALAEDNVRRYLRCAPLQPLFKVR